MTPVWIIVAASLVAYSNGANDNFKGVATFFGSKTADYRSSIAWATVTTFAGSIASLIWAESLLERFSGAGLVPDQSAASPDFLLAVALGAGLTVMLATLTGFPISTTHSLTGALAGSGLVAVGSRIDLAVLGGSFFLPLLLSPLAATVLAFFVYTVFRRARLRLGISKEWCICIGESERVVPIAESDRVLAGARFVALDAAVGSEAHCIERYAGRILGINCQRALDFAHFLSAGVVSFARGLNDTPKIVALLVSVRMLGIEGGTLWVACGIAAGGLLNARSVAETMSHRITVMNHGQGFAANVVTGLLVVFASRLGLPVSTTHVSVGSLLGVGLVAGRARLPVVSQNISVLGSYAAGGRHVRRSRVLAALRPHGQALIRGERP